jgi:glycosyltransferase involved in cell wall biosynthesis
MKIPNAVDLSRFSPQPKNVSLLQELVIQEDDVVVMHVANLQERKRSLDLVALADLTVGEHPRMMFVIVGDGPLRQEMEQACRDRNLSERFRYLGWVDYSRIPEYINLADLIVMPSESEGLSRVYLETQACGRLILASDIPPAREMIKDGETGLLFRMGDLHDLAAKTLLAARNPALRKAVGQKAREEVQAYSLDFIADKYSTILQDVVQHYQR